MSRLEKQFLLMAVASAVSLLVYFAYFFLPRSILCRTGLPPGEPDARIPAAGFVPVAGQWGIAFYHQGLTGLRDARHATGSGVALGDFDGDGRTDIYLVNATPASADARRPCGLYLNRGRHSFALVPDAGGADPGGLNMGVVCADYDGDGDLDLYVTRVGPDRLFRNDGTGRFEDVTEASGIDNAAWATGAAFADYDRDGDLDLFVTNHVDGQANVLFRNEGAGTFTNVTAEAGITARGGRGMAAAFVDLNGDAWPDVYVVNHGSSNGLYVNQRDGTFAEQGKAAGIADGRGGLGVAVGDYDLDGRLDVFCTRRQDELNVLYRNIGPVGPVSLDVAPHPAVASDEVALRFEDVTAAAALGRTGFGLTGWGTVFFDADHDGDLDLYLTHGYPAPAGGGAGTCDPQPDRLLINVSGRFVDQSLVLLRDVPVGAGRGLAAADLDGDGDLDLVKTTNNGPALVLENWCAQGHWLIVKPLGRVVVGCRVRLTAVGREQIRVIQAGTSFLSCEPPEAHFGLGDAAVAARIEVTWPDGRTRVWQNVPADQRFIAEPAS